MRKTAIFWFMFVLTLLISGVLLTAQDATGDDTRIAFVSNRFGNEEIFLMTQAGERGTVTNLTNNPARDWDPVWSPQGDRLLFNSNRDGRDTLYIMDLNDRVARPLFPGEIFQDYDAAWSPDGTRIAFASNRGEFGREIFIASSDGTNIQPLTDDGRLKGGPAWSPDGEELIFWEVQDTTGEIHLFRRAVASDFIQLVASDPPANGAAVWVGDSIYFDSNRQDDLWYIFRTNPEGAQPRRISTQGVHSGQVSHSPDGSRLAFVTDRDDNDEIYIMNADGSGLVRLTDNRFSDHSPTWQPIVPPDQPFEGVSDVEPTPEGGNDLLGAAVGLSANGVIAYPLTLDRLLVDYGIAAWHDAGWTGAGQRIGVIDLGFGDLATFRERSSAVALPLLPDHDLAAYSTDLNEHGTNVLKVIHAIAPNADFYVCRYDGQLNNLETCVNWMQSQNVNIINHSVGLPILPINGQHDWAQLVNDTFARGILWVNSSGNFDQGYWQDNFNDPDGDDYHDFFIGAAQRDGLPVDAEGVYSGTILVSWNEEGIFVVNENGIRERVNLDVEIVGLASGTVLGGGYREQNSQLNAPSAEIVRLSNVSEPFMIRVKNAGGQLTQNMEFMIFVEFAPVQPVRGTNSIVAPADAVSSLTVGSVNARSEIALYSSRGVISQDYGKPDIAAPGEIELDINEPPFIGTSAAAPVVAGMAALLLEENPALGVDRVKRQLQTVWVERRDSLPYGAGIVRLGPPPSSRIGDVVVDTPPRTVFPLPEEINVESGVLSCPGPLPTRFEIGVPGYVNYDLRLRMRAEPGEGTEIAQLEFGTPFEVIGGPECVGGMYWWLIEVGTGAEGWVGEGFDFYFITPTSLERARYPVAFDTVCPNAPDTLLEIGGQARMLRGGLFFFRGLGARAVRGEMDPLPANTIVEILGGPVCEGDADNLLRWYVRVIDGPRAGHEGWAQEGITLERTMAPESQLIPQEDLGDN